MGPIAWLKASYLAGAAADAVVAVMMLMPSRMGETGFRYSMGLGASLMVGWFLLLLWGYRRPVERKGILLLTVFPVLNRAHRVRGVPVRRRGLPA